MKYLVESGETERAREATAAAEVIFKLRASPGTHFHPASRASHAMTLLMARRADAARLEIEPALAEIERLLGPKHPLTRRAREDLALAHLYLGQTEQAERVMQAIEQAQAEGRPSWRPQHLRSLAARLRDDPGSAVRHARAALAAISGQRADIDRMRVLPNLGLSLAAAGEHAQAKTVCDEAIALLTGLQSRVSAERADASLCLGRALLGLGHAADALPPLQLADGFWRELDGTSRWAGEAAYWLARSHDALGHGVEARQAHARAVAALARSPMPADTLLVKSARAALAAPTGAGR